MDFQFLIDKNIKNSCVSGSLNHFKKRFNDKYALSDIDPRSNKPCIFFGIYNTYEWQNYFNYKGPKFILFGGTDINPFHLLGKFNIRLIIQYKIKNILVLSEKAKHNLTRLNIQSLFFDMNLVNKNLFFPKQNKQKSNKIYCYNGTFGKPRPDTYGGNLLIMLKQKLTNYEFIFSSDVNYAYEKMPDLYNSVFIVLRLTSQDGNANTVQECEAMNIPVVHNISKYGLKYKNIDDIIKHINHAYNNQ
tara:strand:+ start:949 stop:1686 length:738 start_codon:yes stop_codon:yes gene_type:complete